ncbi:hypothetical protein H6G97_51250 [Nostoc flagelliforme FACHB-838]|uniref:Uncharacterized protein n=1 Tax=Nostoc flagelliforme FACHB-838 TaxID=2692904 RepID=A0ABR8E6D8_9NOSO|nr:hypothetical protein [Nostoc flagelliforme]MBD2537124.1 hypothetical protein [Nostoc flagelliforme FACHB-838]
MTEEHPDYQKASELENTFYKDKNRVYLVRLDYSDGDYFVGAVHAFLQGYKLQSTLCGLLTPTLNARV